MKKHREVEKVALALQFQRAVGRCKTVRERLRIHLQSGAVKSRDGLLRYRDKAYYVPDEALIRKERANTRW